MIAVFHHGPIFITNCKDSPPSEDSYRQYLLLASPALTIGGLFMNAQLLQSLKKNCVLSDITEQIVQGHWHMFYQMMLY